MEQDPIPQYEDALEQPSLETALPDFVQMRTRILNTKLAVFSTEIEGRLNIRESNLKAIDKEVAVLSKQQHLWQPRDALNQVESAIAELNEQVRKENAECWRDLVPVIRDLLNTWEAHEQAKARSMLFDHV